jgi:hypothetical protein
MARSKREALSETWMVNRPRVRCYNSMEVTARLRRIRSAEERWRAEIGINRTDRLSAPLSNNWSPRFPWLSIAHFPIAIQ